MHLCRSSSNVPRLPSFGNATKPSIPCACHAKPHLNVQKCSVPLIFLHFWLRNVLRATTACTFSTSQLPKVVRGWWALYILTWKCASRHKGVHFFDIATSKSASNLVCFVHFDLEMCFAPQQRALFRHLNFQKWSEHGVLYILPLKCASRQNRVQLFIFHLTTWLRTRRFSEPTFRPSSLEKHSVLRLSYLFAHRDLLSSVFWSSFFFSSLLWLFPPVLFHLSILSEVWLLNFLRWETVWDNPTLRQWNWNSQAFGVQLFGIFSVWSFAVILNLIVRDEFSFLNKRRHAQQQNHLRPGQRIEAGSAAKPAIFEELCWQNCPQEWPITLDNYKSGRGYL